MNTNPTGIPNLVFPGVRGNPTPSPPRAGVMNCMVSISTRSTPTFSPSIYPLTNTVVP